MDTAEVALLVSIASAAFTAASLALQAVLHRLQGHRVEVRLLPMIEGDLGSLYTGPDSGWRKRPVTRDELQFPFLELAAIRVTNVGRSPVSVSDIMLDFGRLKRWNPKTRLLLGGHCLDLGEKATESKLARLEPGDYTHVVFEAWSLIEAAREYRGSKLRIRASAKPAGGRVRRSAWSKRWRINQNQYSFADEASVGDTTEAEFYIFRGLWMQLYHRGAHDVAHIVWRTVEYDLDRSGDDLANFFKAEMPTIVEETPYVPVALKFIRDRAGAKYPDAPVLSAGDEVNQTGAATSSE